MVKKYGFEEFLAIISTLRSENGCPWDKEQTHTSLKKCLIEESYEVLEGIDRYEKTGDFSNLREELGDVLLQVVMHCQIAKENKQFSMEDVIQEIAEKMIRRHPHVFANDQIEDSDGVIKKWEEIKKEEKEERKEEDSLHNIPKAFPPLLRASKVIKKAEKRYGLTLKEEELYRLLLNGMEQLNKSSFVKEQKEKDQKEKEKKEKDQIENDQIENDQQEKDQKENNQKEKDQKDKETILGEMLFNLIKLSRKLKINPEDALNAATNRFIELCDNTPE